MKKILACSIATAIMLSLLSFNISAEEEIAIDTPAELMNMKPDGNYYLSKDIDLSETNWNAVDNFSGSFDGNGYEIYGLTSQTYGLFSNLKSGATIKNVELTNTKLTSKFKNVGGIVSVIISTEKNITIDSCFVSGAVGSCRYKFYQSEDVGTAGSIVGYNNSEDVTISNCYSNAHVASERIVGGIAGINKGTIENSGFGGTLHHSYNVGIFSDRENEEYKADLYAQNYVNGGIVGINYGDIVKCFNSANIYSATYSGGIAGAMQGESTMKSCVNSGFVKGVPYYNTGLLTGYNPSTGEIENCATIYGEKSSAENDVGVGNDLAVTKPIKKEDIAVAESYDEIDGEWIILNENPVLKQLEKFVLKEKFDL